MKRSMILSLFTTIALLVLPTFLLAADPAKSKADFDKTVKLYSMDEALKVSEATGLPVACWMGKNIFDKEENRIASLMFKDTTLQATMDKDGSAADALGFRLKFSSNNYKGDEKIYNVKIANLSKPGMVQEVLRIMRGGEPTTKVREIK